MTLQEDISQAIDVLHRGGVILYPTDTVWGIGCDATNPEAVARIYQIKQRNDSKAMIILIDSTGKIGGIVADPPEIALDILEIATKPTTIVFDGARNLAKNLISENGSIAIRITEEAVSKLLCQRFKRPIVSTSANRSGQPTPALFSEINQELLSQVDYVMESRRQETIPAKPSSIIKVGASGQIKIIRE